VALRLHKAENAKMTSRSDQRLASIIIVTYNKLEFTRPCLESVYRWSDVPFEVIIVDNASTDDTLSHLDSLLEDEPEKYQNLRIVRSPENLGFGQGSNAGAEIAKGEFIVFLNNDTLVHHGWLSRLLAAIDGSPNAGIAGPMTNIASNEQLLPVQRSSSAEDFQREAEDLMESQAGKTLCVTRLIGFCIALSREAWSECGPFDPRYGLGHFEDDDLCLMLARRGYSCLIAQDVYVHHFAGQTFQTLGVDQLRNLTEKALIFYSKWGNAQKSWPGLMQNLERAVAVIVPFKIGAAIPSWTDGLPPFLVTPVCAPLDSDARAALAAHHSKSQILGYWISTGLRPLGEGLNMGLWKSGFQSFLFCLDLASLPLVQILAMLEVAHEDEPRKSQKPAVILIEACDEVRTTVVALYIRRAGFKSVGYLNANDDDFSHLATNYFRRAYSAGETCERWRVSESGETIVRLPGPAAGRQGALRQLRASILRRFYKSRMDPRRADHWAPEDQSNE
jgi:GT2 family glycosyltransferase